MQPSHSSTADVEITSTSTPKAGWTGPSPSQYVLKEGKSKFYRKNYSDEKKKTIYVQCP